MTFNLKDLLLSLLIFFPIVCIKAETQQLTVTIPISGSIAIEDIDIKIPLYKYNKDFAISFTGDDALLGIYQRPFNYALGKYVDDKDIFHESASVPTSGITPQRMLTFSDGCGNDIPFRFGINWIASKDGKDIHKNGNVWLANMWWSEAERFTDFGNSIIILNIERT